MVQGTVLVFVEFQRRSGYSSDWNIFFFCDMKFLIPGISEVYIFMFYMFNFWEDVQCVQGCVDMIQPNF